MYDIFICIQSDREHVGHLVTLL